MTGGYIIYEKELSELLARSDSEAAGTIPGLSDALDMLFNTGKQIITSYNISIADGVSIKSSPIPVTLYNTGGGYVIFYVSNSAIQTILVEGDNFNVARE